MIKLRNTLNDEILYTEKYEVAKEIDGQKFCLVLKDNKPFLVNMEFWKPTNKGNVNGSI